MHTPPRGARGHASQLLYSLYARVCTTLYRPGCAWRVRDESEVGAWEAVSDVCSCAAGPEMSWFAFGGRAPTRQQLTRLRKRLRRPTATAFCECSSSPRTSHLAAPQDRQKASTKPARWTLHGNSAEAVYAAQQQNEQLEVKSSRGELFDNELDDRVRKKFGRVWLRVARVRPRDPPELPANLAGSGIQMCTDPHILPQPVAGLPSELVAAMDTYLAACEQWRARELARQAAASVYNELFEVHQRMQQPDSEVDLVWGLGWATWAPAGKIIDNAIIEVQVEIELDRYDGALLVRPREYCDATLALAPFEQLGGETQG